MTNLRQSRPGRDASLSPLAVVLCAHGTRDGRGQDVVRELCAQLRRFRPGVRVEDAYVDVQEPKVQSVVNNLVGLGYRVIVIPLLLSEGYHTEVDVAEAVRVSDMAVSTGPLGPDTFLTNVLWRRLKQARADSSDAVVVAAAGSSRPQATEALHKVAGQLRELWGGPVSVGFGSSAKPSVGEAVEQARDEGARRVVVGSYLLGHGFFHSQLGRAGADLVTEPLGAASLVVSRVLAKFDAQVRADRALRRSA
ncbi:MAG: sirohydrochlorin chelatase [Micropruina sp.]|nr:sirohydrochlorin chelatase [Micropruina sp.]